MNIANIIIGFIAMRLISLIENNQTENIAAFCGKNGHKVVGTYNVDHLDSLMGHLGISLGIDGVVVENVQSLGREWQAATRKLSAMGYAVLTTDNLRIDTQPLNCKEIAEAMNRKGIRQENGSLWNPSAVLKLVWSGG